MTNDLSESALSNLKDLFEGRQWPDLKAACLYNLKIFPQSSLLWNLLGVSNQKLNQLQESRFCLARAIELDANFSDAYNNLAITLGLLGDSDGSRKAIETALITSDFGVSAAMEIVDKLRAAVDNKVITTPAELVPAVQAELFEMIEPCEKFLEIDDNRKPYVILMVGVNGAGKTTTLKAISNLLHSERGEVTKGTITYRGTDVGHLKNPSELVRKGVIQVMEGRHCFEHLTVEENLLTGAYTRGDGRGAIDADLDLVYSYFPRLKERRKSQAGYTSGGEQQMTAIGRALMSKPETILLDEPSMGLAPQLVEEIFGIVKELNEKEGVSFLLAEQNTNVALRFAHYGYILESGRVVMDGPAADLRENPDVKEFYLGMSEEGRKSYRDVRSYRRRKRWLS